MKDIIRGHYWLISYQNKKYITEGSKPTRLNGISWERHGSGMNWLCLEPCQDKITEELNYAIKNGEIITGKDFSNLKFPKIKDEDEPIEIEIGSSGRVYTY